MRRKTRMQYPQQPDEALSLSSQELRQSTCSGWRSRHRSCGPSAQFPCSGIAKFAVNVCSLDTNKNANKTDGCRSLVPLAGIEPAPLAELDFESSASTSS